MIRERDASAKQVLFSFLSFTCRRVYIIWRYFEIFSSTCSFKGTRFHCSFVLKNGIAFCGASQQDWTWSCCSHWETRKLRCLALILLSPFIQKHSILESDRFQAQASYRKSIITNCMQYQDGKIGFISPPSWILSHRTAQSNSTKFMWIKWMKWMESERFVNQLLIKNVIKHQFCFFTHGKSNSCCCSISPRKPHSSFSKLQTQNTQSEMTTKNAF